MIDELITDIKEVLNVPYIAEDDIVIDGCFAVTPFLTDSLIGSGTAVSITNHYTADIFYKNKLILMNATIELFKELLNKRYACEAPNYTYDSASGLWQASMNVQEVRGI